MYRGSVGLRRLGLVKWRQTERILHDKLTGMRKEGIWLRKLCHRESQEHVFDFLKLNTCSYDLAGTQGVAWHYFA